MQTKIQEVEFGAYEWPTDKNLARDAKSQGARDTVYRDLLSAALQGHVPTIHTPIQAGQAKGKTVPYVISGVGRLISVGMWIAQTPDERFQSALSLFRSARSDNPISAEQASKLTLANLHTYEEFALGSAKPGTHRADPVAIRKAFESTPSVPVIWYAELNEDEAKRAAIRDLINRDLATVSDKIRIYQTEVERPGISKGAIADLLGLSAARISNYAKYTSVLAAGGISPMLDRMIMLHNGGHTPEKPLLFDNVVKLLGVGSKGAKYKAAGGLALANYDRDTQDAALQFALEAVHAMRGTKGPLPSLDTASDSDLLGIRYPDFVTFFVQLRAAVASQTGEDKGKAEVNPNEPLKSDQRPSLANIIRFLEPERWASQSALPLVSPIQLWVYGHITAAEAARQLDSAKRERKGKSIESTNLPDTLGAAIESAKPKPEPKPKAEKPPKGEGKGRRGRPAKAKADSE
jgi:hypothetical protein